MPQDLNSHEEPPPLSWSWTSRSGSRPAPGCSGAGGTGWTCSRRDNFKSLSISLQCSCAPLRDHPGINIPSNYQRQVLKVGMGDVLLLPTCPHSCRPPVSLWWKPASALLSLSVRRPRTAPASGEGGSRRSRALTPRFCTTCEESLSVTVRHGLTVIRANLCKSFLTPCSLCVNGSVILTEPGAPSPRPTPAGDGGRWRAPAA